MIEYFSVHLDHTSKTWKKEKEEEEEDEKMEMKRKRKWRKR